MVMQFDWPRLHDFFATCDWCNYRWDCELVSTICPKCDSGAVHVTNGLGRYYVPEVYERNFDQLLDPDRGYIHGEPLAVYWHEMMRLSFLDDQLDAANEAALEILS